MNYRLYLNDKPYGIGDLKYMNELISDWLNCNMYGSDQSIFKIEKIN